MSHQKIVKRLNMKNIRYDMTLKFVETGIDFAIVDLSGTFTN
jgi:hypothetical protein